MKLKDLDYSIHKCYLENLFSKETEIKFMLQADFVFYVLIQYNHYGVSIVNKIQII